MEKINASIASYSMLEGSDDDGEEYVVESEDEEYLSSEKAWMKAHNEEDVDEDDAEEAEEDDTEEAEEEEVDEEDVDEDEVDEADEENDAEEADEDDAGEAEEEEVDENDAEEEVEEAEEEDDDEEYDEELIEIEVDGVTYYTSETKDGKIYELLENDEIGDDVGQYVNGEPIIF